MTKAVKRLRNTHIFSNQSDATLSPFFFLPILSLFFSLSSHSHSSKFSSELLVHYDRTQHNITLSFLPPYSLFTLQRHSSIPTLEIPIRLTARHNTTQPFLIPSSLFSVSSSAPLINAYFRKTHLPPSTAQCTPPSPLSHSARHQVVPWRWWGRLGSL